MKLIFYNDSPVFGGHEVMTLLGIRGWLESHPDPVVCFSSAANTTYLEKLNGLAKHHNQLQVETVPWQAHKLEALRNRFLPSRARQLAKLIKSYQADLVLAIQGNIELSSLLLHAARIAGVQSCSYIPVPHSHVEMGAKLGHIRDVICRHVYQLPNHYITCTHALADKLKERSGGIATHVAYNGVEIEKFQAGSKKEAQQRYKLPSDKTILGMVGRLEFKQKQQHLLVEAVASRQDLNNRCHLVFCGDGPDKEALIQLIDRHDVSATIIPWTDPAPLYPALHALVIPSRYEGLPLVMLEALASGVTVIGSDRDGMKDLLPKSRRFSPSQPDALTDTIFSFLADDSPGPEPALVSRVRRDMSHDAFQASFNKAIELIHQGA